MSLSHGHCLELHDHRGSDAISYDSPKSPSRFNLPPERDRRGTRTSMVEEKCVYDSSAYFIRDMATAREVLIFGDVEADSISLSPRNIGIWKEAAPKIALGKLSAIFIECSYLDQASDDYLYGMSD
jgi:hypothetical protein